MCRPGFSEPSHLSSPRPSISRWVIVSQASQAYRDFGSCSKCCFVEHRRVDKADLANLTYSCIEQISSSCSGSSEHMQCIC